MRFSGSWTIARVFDVPIRIHWSVPVFVLLAGGFRFVPGTWLGALLLILIHEVGHAFVVRQVRARALSIEVLGFGGLCVWEGEVTRVQRACIAWGGVWAQMIVLAAALIGVAVFGEPQNVFAQQMVDAAIRSNLWLIGVNLLPIPPLDGSEAWPLFPLLWRRFQRRRALKNAAQRALAGDRSAAATLSAITGHTTTPPARSEPPATRTTTSSKPPVDVLTKGGKLRISVLDQRQIRRPPSTFEETDDPDLTPEAIAIVEAARKIAREAAVNPNSDKPAPSAEKGHKNSGT